MATGELAGQRVLVVEDDWFIASYVAEALERAGAAVLGPTPSVSGALALLAENRPDAATLNLSLDDGDSTPVARRLAELDVPFLFLSAHAASVLPPDLKARPRLDKPFAGFEVVQALATLTPAA